MLKLATLLDNPGEPPCETRYRDPAVLAELGYNGVVLYATTALSGVADGSQLNDPELRAWLEQHAQRVDREIEAARRAGLSVYLFYDTLVLAANARGEPPRDMTCTNNPRLLCPANGLALAASVEALERLLDRWPTVDGVVLRFGETDAPRLPHLVGNDIYRTSCQACKPLSRADRIVNVIEAFYLSVVSRRRKRLIARAWNVKPGGLHDNATLAREVADRLPGRDDPPGTNRLILSFKFTHTDFWRYQPWNPASLAVGDRPVIYELECQREFEGKGGVANWQVPLWRDGMPEQRSTDGPATPRDDAADRAGGPDSGSGAGSDAQSGSGSGSGLAAAAGRINLAGLWAWVRGGGWGGPFVSDERWIDANVWAVPRLADEPDADPVALAEAWIDQRLPATIAPVREALTQTLTESSELVRAVFYIEPYARMLESPWHPNGDWVQDDLIRVAALLRMLQRLNGKQLEAAVREKQDAVARISRLRTRLATELDGPNQDSFELLLNSMVYFESLAETVRDLVAGIAAYRRFQARPDAENANAVRHKLRDAQHHWHHHTQRLGGLPGCATTFREVDFWDVTDRLLDDVDKKLA